MFKRTFTAVLLCLAISTPMFAAQSGRGDDSSPVAIFMRTVKKVAHFVVHAFDDGYEITVPKP